MSNSIGSVGGYSQTMMQSMGRMQRPDPSKMADDLFSKIDTSGKGYIDKADLASAFDGMASSGNTASVDDVFSSFDTDSDGKITKQEMTDTLQSMADTLENQFQSMRMEHARQGMNDGGMPPPPPPQDNDQGFTQDELSSQLDSIGDSDDKRASLISNILDNFDQADSDSDGKVSFEEAMAYDKSKGGETAGTASTTDTDTTSTSGSKDAQVMMTIMKLMHSYGAFGSASAQAETTGLVSESA